MNTRRRILSITLVICLMFGCSTTFAFANSGSHVYVRATQNYDKSQKVFKLINKERAKRGLKKLKLDKGLCDDAVQRGAEIAIAVPWKSPHKRPNGKLVRTLDKRINYECCLEGYISASEVVKEWMDSPPHRAGILLKNARSVGVACVNGGYWTLEFSSTKAKKAEKRTGSVTYKKKVVMKKKLMKKKYFSLYINSQYINGVGFGPNDDGIWELTVGQKGNAFPRYSGGEMVPGWTTPLHTSKVKFESSNPDVLSVDKKGNVTAVSPGNATLSATLKYGPKYTVKLKAIVSEEDDWNDYEDDWDDYDYDYGWDDGYYN